MSDGDSDSGSKKVVFFNCLETGHFTLPSLGTGLGAGGDEMWWTYTDPSLVAAAGSSQGAWYFFSKGYLATTTLIYSFCCPVFSQQGVVSPLTQKGLLLYLTLEQHKWENQEAAPHSATRLRKEAAQQCEGVEMRAGGLSPRHCNKDTAWQKETGGKSGLGQWSWDGVGEKTEVRWVGDLQIWHLPSSHKVHSCQWEKTSIPEEQWKHGNWALELRISEQIPRKPWHNGLWPQKAETF